MTFFDYFQVASVAAFLLIIISRVVYMRLTRHINPIVIGGGKTGLVLVVELLAFAGLALWMVELLLYAFHSSVHIFPPPFDALLIESPIAKWIGVALVSIGILIFIMAFLSFGDSWRVGFDMKNPGALVTNGIFAISRNPIYLFLDLWFIGIFLINGRLIFFIYVVLVIADVHWQILQEEAFLTKLYGKPYKNYLTRTGRYVGFWR
jgi:protein-S-isoprenylcysteine O-methyltransferase Ste14